jgi:hypothetical protein
LSSDVDIVARQDDARFIPTTELLFVLVSCGLKLLLGGIGKLYTTGDSQSKTVSVSTTTIIGVREFTVLEIAFCFPFLGYAHVLSEPFVIVEDSRRLLSSDAKSISEAC